MQELNIKHDSEIENFAPSELTLDRKKIIESKLQNFLLSVLIQNGGEVVLLESQTTTTQTS
jgi:hypothetical protein